MIPPVYHMDFNLDDLEEQEVQGNVGVVEDDEGDEGDEMRDTGQAASSPGPPLLSVGGITRTRSRVCVCYAYM